MARAGLLTFILEQLYRRGERPHWLEMPPAGLKAWQARKVGRHGAGQNQGVELNYDGELVARSHRAQEVARAAGGRPARCFFGIGLAPSSQAIAPERL